MSVRGWCPGALRPMMSGDGLVLRIRPHAGRLSVAQARAVADLAQAHGNGRIDLGARAHLQLRGVAEAALPALWAALADLGLLDADTGAEARRNILTTPIHGADETLALVAALEEGLRTGPDLPAKFGFAVDTGAAAVLGGASADLRIERAADGLILRAEGMARGEAVSAAQAVPRALEIARWFAARRGAETRIARLGFAPPLRAEQPPLTGAVLVPGATPFGLCIGLPFGQIGAQDLHRLALAPLRLTPWRSVLLEGVAAADLPPGLIRDAADPLLRVSACTGAPGCASATVETRALARRLAAGLPAGATLHVSGCAKGCAHPRPADITLTGRDGAFDLILNAGPAAAPLRRGLGPADIPDAIRGSLAPRL